MKTIPIGDYDKRITILTQERGKISAFAKGARRQNSRLMAATNPFSFGEFRLFEGRTSYNLVEANISNYFEPLRIDYEAAYFGMYFLEVSDFYTRENNDEVAMLKLLYQSLRALTISTLNKDLVQYIFEIKSLVVNGEFPGVLNRERLLSDTVYTIDFIVNSSIEKLYTFMVSKEVLLELSELSKQYRTKYISNNFKSLEILQNCRLKN